MKKRVSLLAALFWVGRDLVLTIHTQNNPVYVAIFHSEFVVQEIRNITKTFPNINTPKQMKKKFFIEKKKVKCKKVLMGRRESWNLLLTKL